MLKKNIIGWKSLCVKVTVKPMVMLKILPDEKKVSIHAGRKKLSKSRKLWRDKLSLKRKNTRCPRSSVATPPGARAN